MKKKSLLVYGLSAMCLSFALPGPVAAVSNESCMECHSDDSLERDASTGHLASLFVDIEKFNASVHNFDEESCVGCHNAIEELDWDSDVPHPVDMPNPDCAECHDETVPAWAGSVHAEADITCYDCHNYHAPVQLAGRQTVAMMREEVCGKCHDAGASHDWLPQKEVHFSTVQCTVCHAPEDGSHVSFRLYDVTENRFLSGNEIMTGLQISGSFMANFDTDGDGVISPAEFQDFGEKLRERRFTTDIRAELNSDDGPMAHKIVAAGAISDCEICHSGDSALFADARFELTSADGEVEFAPVNGKAAANYYVEDFYALSATRVTLLDIIGALLIIGGFGVVILHSGAKKFTKPLREKRKAEQSH